MSLVSGRVINLGSTNRGDLKFLRPYVLHGITADPKSISKCKYSISTHRLWDNPLSCVKRPQIIAARLFKKH
jgi:hypothetical protein